MFFSSFICSIVVSVYLDNIISKHELVNVDTVLCAPGSAIPFQHVLFTGDLLQQNWGELVTAIILSDSSFNFKLFVVFSHEFYL